MLSDLVIASANAKWEKGLAAPQCPTCKKMLLSNGKKKRELQVRGGKSVKLEREYDICPECGQGIFLLDEELELLPGRLSPHGYESLVRLAGWAPFKRAAEILDDFMGI